MEQGERDFGVFDTKLFLIGDGTRARREIDCGVSLAWNYILLL